jgi:hypothetical protein
VYSIIRAHGGHIEAQSEPGRGALFTLHLPACARRSSPVPAKPLQDLEGLRVLVMDDEADPPGRPRHAPAAGLRGAGSRMGRRRYPSTSKACKAEILRRP